MKEKELLNLSWCVWSHTIRIIFSENMLGVFLCDDERTVNTKYEIGSVQKKAKMGALWGSCRTCKRRILFHKTWSLHSFALRFRQWSIGNDSRQGFSWKNQKLYWIVLSMTRWIPERCIYFSSLVLSGARDVFSSDILSLSRDLVFKV